MTAKTDRELLGLAAKAAGMDDLEHDALGFYRVIGEHEDGMLAMVYWNPLTDDGDALRLAVNLNILVDPSEIDGFTECVVPLIFYDHVVHGGDPYSATRRAIVRAAAAIGETL